MDQCFNGETEKEPDSNAESTRTKRLRFSEAETETGFPDPRTFCRRDSRLANGRFNISFDSDLVPQGKAIVVLRRTVFLVRKSLGESNRFLPFCLTPKPFSRHHRYLNFPSACAESAQNLKN
jgi:hypothetical protein